MSGYELARRFREEEKAAAVAPDRTQYSFEEFLARQGVALLNNDNGRSARGTEVSYTSPEAVRFVDARVASLELFAGFGTSTA